LTQISSGIKLKISRTINITIKTITSMLNSNIATSLIKAVTFTSQYFFNHEDNFNKILWQFCGIEINITEFYNYATIFMVSLKK